MSYYQTCLTNPHQEIDPLTRIRVLELQMAAIADAVRVLADAIDHADPRAGIAKRVDGLLRDTCLPHL